jgi:CRP-like cAMP-binding protein
MSPGTVNQDAAVAEAEGQLARLGVQVEAMQALLQGLTRDMHSAELRRDQGQPGGLMEVNEQLVLAALASQAEAEAAQRRLEEHLLSSALEQAAGTLGLVAAPEFSGPAVLRWTNRLLALLPEEDWQRWRPHLTLVNMPLGQVLYESGATLSHGYLPTTATVSLMYVTEDGASSEIAMVGNDGIVGIPLFMGGESTPSRAVVQSAGEGLRMCGRAIREEFAGSPAVMKLLLRYTQALIGQMAQLAICNRHHTVDERLCRWLLLSLDRRTGNELVVTQELIASMLGVRREGVTEAALALQRDGLIHYRRGHITVTDRPGLEQRSCECYGVVRGEYDRLLPPIVPAAVRKAISR